MLRGAVGWPSESFQRQGEASEVQTESVLGCGHPAGARGRGTGRKAVRDPRVWWDVSTQDRDAGGSLAHSRAHAFFRELPLSAKTVPGLVTC